MSEIITEVRCLDSHKGDCEGKVEYRISLSPTGRSFPRCEKHWHRRLDEQERIVARVGHWDSDVAPTWFDPTACGERWDDE